MVQAPEHGEDTQVSLHAAKGQGGGDSPHLAEARHRHSLEIQLLGTVMVQVDLLEKAKEVSSV